MTGYINWHDMDAKGRPTSTFPNCLIALGLLPGVKFGFDKFKGRIEVRGLTSHPGWIEFSDEQLAILRHKVLETFDFDGRPGNMLDAVAFLATRRKRDSVKRYLAKLQWDGKRRLRKWLVRYLGAEDTPLNRAIGELMLVALVSRALRPGVKFDHLIVLVGAQGGGKSTALRTIAVRKSWFSDQDILHLGAREQQELLQGVWLYEVSELAGMSKADAAKFKAFVSRQTDRARQAFGRMRFDQDRNGILVGTCNEPTFLTDTTGNRRVLPVQVGAIRLKALRRVRDQLLAEAVILANGKPPLRLPRKLWAAAAKVQAERMLEDPWMERLEGLCRDRDRIPFAEIAQGLGLSFDRQSVSIAKRVADCMRRLGFERRSFKLAGRVVRGYVRASTPQ